MALSWSRIGFYEEAQKARLQIRVGDARVATAAIAGITRRTPPRFAYLWLFIMYNWRESACHRGPREATGPEAISPSMSLRIRLAALHFGPTPAVAVLFSSSISFRPLPRSSVSAIRVVSVTSGNNSVNCTTDLLLIAIRVGALFTFSILSVILWKYRGESSSFRISDLSVQRNGDNSECEENILRIDRWMHDFRKKIFHYYLIVHLRGPQNVG